MNMNLRLAQNIYKKEQAVPVLEETGGHIFMQHYYWNT